MNFLIAGLGNIGEEYANTRHNIGFDVLDMLAKDNKVAFELGRNAFYTTYKSKGKQVHLIKPTTYMNLSGKAVRYWMQELKIPQERVLIVLDDLAIDFGALRLRGKGSDGGHNGLKDIDLMLGNQNYARLRFGIGSNYAKGGQINYVLGKWKPEEAKHLPEHIDRACQAINSFMFEGLGNAMTKYNK